MRPATLIVHVVIVAVWLVTLASLARSTWRAWHDADRPAQPRRTLPAVWATTALVGVSALYIALTNAVVPGLRLGADVTAPAPGDRLMLLGELVLIAQAVLALAVVTVDPGAADARFAAGDGRRAMRALTTTAGLLAGGLAFITAGVTAALAMLRS
jgi:hypothetical protein